MPSTDKRALRAERDALKRKLDETLAELDSTKSALQKREQDLTGLIRKYAGTRNQIREAVRALRDTKGFVRSRTIQKIREGLEETLPECMFSVWARKEQERLSRSQTYGVGFITTPHPSCPPKNEELLLGEKKL